jgi:hypothetical protein
LEDVVSLIAVSFASVGPEANIFKPEMYGREIGDVVVCVEDSTDVDVCG